MLLAVLEANVLVGSQVKDVDLEIIRKKTYMEETQTKPWSTLQTNTVF